MQTPSTLDTLGERLQFARLLSGLSASALSVLAGLSASHVGLIERGTVDDPGGVSLNKLAVVLGIDLDWLIAGRGKQPRKTVVHAAVESARAARHTASDFDAPKRAAGGR